MGKTRKEFHQYLKDMSKAVNIYFQPPSNIKMKYPAIVYVRDNINNTFADNSIYNQSMVYSVTVIDSNPDSEIVKNVSLIPTARYNRHFISDNLNHDIFSILY